MQIVRKLEIDFERSQSKNVRVRKITSEHQVKYVKSEQKIHMTNKEGKIAAAAIKQIAS